jgi:hypothetical protein
LNNTNATKKLGRNSGAPEGNAVPAIVILSDKNKCLESVLFETFLEAGS